MIPLISDLGSRILDQSASIRDPRSAIVETSLPSEPEIAVAAFAPLPKVFGEKDRQRLAVAVRVLADGTQEYSRRTIFNFTQGGAIQAALLPDGVILRLVGPRTSLVSLIAVMEGLLRRPVLDGVSLDHALRRLQRGEPGYWSSALWARRNELKSIKPDEARAVLMRVFDPARTIVAAAGGFVAGEPQRLWEGRTKDWKAAPVPRYPDISKPDEATEGPSGLTTVELRGAPFPIGEPTFPARWLAMIALGVGKGSSLFRDVRQVEAWSYRQEAVLWPDLLGLEPRIVVAATPEEGESSRAEGLRATIQKAVAAWTEDDRTRALGMASLTLERGLPLGPLWIADAPVGASLADRAMLDAYWWSKAGVRWNAAHLLEAMRNVPLDALKTEANAFLANAKPIVLSGR